MYIYVYVYVYIYMYIYIYISSIYFCSFTLSWRYCTKLRTKKIFLSIGILIVYLLITSQNLQLKAYIPMYKHDFICLSETYLDSSTHDK